jgi:hypothetical protein
VVVSNVTVRKAMPCLYLLQTLAVTPLDPEWSVDTPVTFNGEKILSLFVLGVVLALMTAPAFAQDDITQLPSVEHSMGPAPPKLPARVNHRLVVGKAPVR